jgi:hypothetical protein
MVAIKAGAKATRPRAAHALPVMTEEPVELGEFLPTADPQGSPLLRCETGDVGARRSEAERKHLHHSSKLEY